MNKMLELMQYIVHSKFYFYQQYFPMLFNTVRSLSALLFFCKPHNQGFGSGSACFCPARIWIRINLRIRMRDKRYKKFPNKSHFVE